MQTLTILIGILFMTYSTTLKADKWQVVNDGVMGGLSYGKVVFDNQVTIFKGHISTENNGGFSSAYKPIAKLSKNIHSVQITIKGDGLRYQLRARSQVEGYEIAYKIEFDTTANEVETFIFKLNEFQATFRGRNINNAPELKAETISYIGFLINHKKATDFLLSIQSVYFIE